MYWTVVGKTDIRARLMADRHYSRQNPGTPEFCPPGNSIVLIVSDIFGNAKALWCSHRPTPNSIFTVRKDGFSYWHNPYFRNESGLKSSLLILEALAVTLHLWDRKHLPVDGFHTFIDPTKTRPITQRGKEIHGFCFRAAGFTEHPVRTKTRNLIRYIMPLEKLLEIEPEEPYYDL